MAMGVGHNILADPDAKEFLGSLRILKQAAPGSPRRHCGQDTVAALEKHKIAIGVTLDRSDRSRCARHHCRSCCDAEAVAGKPCIGGMLERTVHLLLQTSAILRSSERNHIHGR